MLRERDLFAGGTREELGERLQEVVLQEEEVHAPASGCLSILAGL